MNNLEERKEGSIIRTMFFATLFDLRSYIVFEAEGKSKVIGWGS
jgi:hypothetical protein